MSDKELIEKIEDAHRRVRKIGPDAIYETELREVLRAAADALEAATDGDYHEGLEEGIKIGRAECDAALAAIERVRAEADAYAEQPDVMELCGAVAQALRTALDGAPEPEWEYGMQDDLGLSRASSLEDARRHARFQDQALTPRVVRRRKAGPWLPVEGESKS